MVVEQTACDAVRISVEKAQPAQAVDAGEFVEQRGETVLEAEVFAVAGGVLADERNLLDAARNELLGFGDDGLETPRAEFAAQVGDDAEGAGVVAALGDFDVGRCARRREKPRGLFVIEICGQGRRCTGPGVAAEAACAFAAVAFWSGGGRSSGSCACRPAIPCRAWLSAWALREDGEERGRSGGSGREPRGFQNRFELAGADHGVDFRNVLHDLVAVALHQAAGNDELFGAALSFVAGHFENGVDRLLLGGVDEGAGVDDENLGIFRAAVRRAPARSSRPIITSESTRFLGQPRETNPTVGEGGAELLATPLFYVGGDRRSGVLTGDIRRGVSCPCGRACREWRDGAGR